MTTVVRVVRSGESSARWTLIDRRCSAADILSVIDSDGPGLPMTSVWEAPLHGATSIRLQTGDGFDVSQLSPRCKEITCRTVGGSPSLGA